MTRIDPPIFIESIGPIAYDHRHGVGAKIRDIDLGTVRGHCHASGIITYWNCRDQIVRRRIDRRHCRGVDPVRDIDVATVRGQHDTLPNCGCVVVIVAVTKFVAASITDMVLDTVLGTYTLLPSGLTVTPKGRVPTEIVAVTLFVLVLITDTLPGGKGGEKEPPFAT